MAQRALVNSRRSDQDHRMASTASGSRTGIEPDAVQELLAESFVAGVATSVQLMVNDSRKYAPTL
jgi:hypothetical protein